jgi:triacylglycerol esterase/lipase EstA (alpha/beta hydrolase family)
MDAVDVIAHSTGGLVARSYIQSAAYGGFFNGTQKLPTFENLIMVGVPNRGAREYRRDGVDLRPD